MSVDISGITGDIYNRITATKQDSATTSAFEEQLKKASQEQDDKALMEACREFETYFVNQMFNAMRKTVQDGGLIPKSNGEKIFEDMLYEEYADEISKGQGVGIAKMMFQQLSNSGSVNEMKNRLK